MVALAELSIFDVENKRKLKKKKSDPVVLGLIVVNMALHMFSLSYWIL